MAEAPRRGRPRRVQIEKPAESVLAQSAPTIESDAPVEVVQKPTQRRRRPSTGGHAYKLTAPSREGETRRWFNDTGDRIAEAKELGYEFVSDTSVKTDQPGSRIARRVGTQANGDAIYAYLMETPDQLYQQGVSEKEEQNSIVDKAIQSGSDFTGRLDQSYGQGSINIER